MKSLDLKLDNIRRDPSGAKDFILADAKDADMATGLAATGKDPRTGKPRTLAQYREQMRDVVRQGLVDIMLMSASSSELLTIKERLFDTSHITPACRANDTTDIHLPAGGTYGAEPSRPFRSATIEQMQSGRVNPTDYERRLGADLGLYSITPNNKLEFDYVTVQAYKEFRIEAEQKGFRHFLEVFDPNACGDACPIDLGRYINDLIVRTLAGVPTAGRPVFLKIVYHGPKAMEELVQYDPSIVVGILGGASGTTYDAFKQLEDAKKYGARVALYGRKINNSEDQLTFITYLRAIADGQIGSQEAVRAYHGDLQKLKLAPHRELKSDLELTSTASSYAGTSSTVTAPGPIEKSKAPAAPKAPPAEAGGAGGATGTGKSPTAAKPKVAAPATTVPPAPAKASASSSANGFPKKADGSPNFKAMSGAQKVAFARQKIQADLSKSGNGAT
jgi:hypothetical protein